MSNWSLCELENFDWDESRKNEDHIVPHPVCKLAAEDDVGIINCSRGSSNTMLWGKKDLSYSNMKNRNSSTIEGPQSCQSNILFPAECYSDNTSQVNISGCHIAENNNDINRDKFISKDPVLGAATSSTNNSQSLRSSLSDVSAEDKDLSMHNEQDRQHDDALYSEWPCIDNFEDVDKMFRTWDSTFGQEDGGNADELPWFSSSPNYIYASGIASEQGLEPLNANRGLNTHMSYDQVPVSAQHCGSGNQGCPVLLDTDDEDDNKFAAKEDVWWDGDEIKSSSRVHTSNENCLSGGGNSNMMECQLISQEKGTKRSADKMLLNTNMEATQTSTSQQFSQQKHFIDSTPSSFMQNVNSHGKMERVPAEQHPVTQATSCIAFENDSMTCSSINDLEYLRTHCSETRSDQFYRAEATIKKNVGKVHQKEHQQDALNKNSGWEKQFDARAGIGQNDTNLGTPTVEISSAVAHENSCMTSVDDISFKVTSFLQLQDVMHQLDVRTKLCIRDSLYRLARSAHQRNDFSHTNTSSEANIDLLGTQSMDAKSVDHVDAEETNTNPIDRSIAHLLFYKTSQTTGMPIDDATSFGSHIINEQPRIDQVVVHNQQNQIVFGGCADTEFLHPDLA